MATILLAEDNEAVRLLTQAKLRHQFTVVTTANGREALDILNRQHVDLIVADVMMPVMDGYQLVRTLRAEGNEIPVLFLTALQSMDSKREGFSSGIDDYLTKPVDYEELIWRIQALLRRAHIASEQQIVVGDTRLDSASYTVTCRGQTLELPKKEFDLLYKLLSYPGQIFTRSQLLDDVWGYVSESGEEKHLTFSAELESVDCTSNEELLRQVWINLLNNAIRYTPPGGEIGVELRRVGGEAVVRVWDTGSGMTPEVQSHIFEKYYQGAAEDKKHGLGLGLSIVHRIVELTEGRIEVDSQPQQGSSFTIYLPLNQKGA